MTHFNALNFSSREVDLDPVAADRLAEALNQATVSSYKGLTSVCSALHGDSFAVFEATQRGAFRIAAKSACAGVGGTGAIRLAQPHLLRWIASSRQPLLWSMDRGGPVGRMLGEHGIRWAVGVPGRAAGHVSGGLIVIGTETPAPCSLQQDLLAHLIVPLGEGLARSEAPVPVQDPMCALRSAAEQRREESPWPAIRRAVLPLKS